MDNRDLDKMIQDKLGDYRETPDPRVWDRVRASLDQKKKKGRLIPLWLRLGGAAAVILAGLFWLVPREALSPDTPAVSRSTPQTEAPVRSKPVTPPSAEESLPEGTGTKLAGEDPSRGETMSPGIPGGEDSRVSESRKTDIPAREIHSRPFRAKDQLAASDSEDRSRGATLQKTEGDGGRSPSGALVTALKKTDAVADSEKYPVEKDPSPPEKKEAAPTSQELPKKSIFEALEPQEAVRCSGPRWITMQMCCGSDSQTQIIASLPPH